VVGTCIQLLLYGSEIVSEAAGSYRKRAKKVASMLKSKLVAGIVKDPHAIEVLKLAILHAETGLKPENDRDDVWALLFPSKSQNIVQKYTDIEFSWNYHELDLNVHDNTLKYRFRNFLENLTCFAS